MAINYYSEDVPVPAFKRRIINAWIKQVAGNHIKKTGEIAYIFCSDEKILEVNKQYLGHDYYTDIITFDYTENTVISGDIYISIDTVKSNAEAFNTSFEDELHRVLIHGILHLCGIDDKGPGERAVMEKNENEALTILSEMQQA